jgi:GWxTD domain-containing protein
MRYSRLLLGILLLSAVSARAVQEKNQSGKPKKEESLSNYYKQWLERDVKYIITEEERAVFLKLQTDEEKEQFIEQFWRRRDPDPTTPENEFREEHYRRIQYANDVFAAGIPGWMTDRGRIYIKYGKPDRIETHPAGGPYQRRQEEGGGWTSTYPFERWEYRHIPGVGDDIEIEFVDYSGGNLYKIANNPNIKDEFLHVPWAGMTEAEENDWKGRDPGELRWARIAGVRDYGVADSMGIAGERAKYTPFARTELAANLQKPPVIQFKDLRAEVTTRISYNLLPFTGYVYFLKLAGNTALAPLTLQIPNSAVTFETQGSLRVSKLQLYGRVSGLTGNTVFEFDDEIVKQLTPEEYAAQKYSSSIYHRLMRLPPGRFKLDVLLKDAVTGKLGTFSQGLAVPAFPDGRFCASPVVLTSEMIPLTEEEQRRDRFAFGRFRIRPRVDETFHKGEYLGVYLEVYSAAIDPSKDRPSVRVEYQLRPRQGTETPYRDVSRSVVMDRDLLAVPLYIDISAHPPGDYTVVFRITDQITNETVETRAAFRIAG